MSTLEEASLVAENTFTEPTISVGGQASGQVDIGVSISGTFVATVTVQRSLDVGATWADLPTAYTAGAEFNIIPNDAAQYRVGVKTGDYTSGTVVVKVRA